MLPGLIIVLRGLEGHAQVWASIKERFAKFAPQRGHTDALWALRKSVVSRRYAFLSAVQGGSAGASHPIAQAPRGTAPLHVGL